VNPSRERKSASAAGIERLNFSLLKRFCDGAAAEIRQGNKVGAAACVSERESRAEQRAAAFQPRAAAV
jgi:hypothetical protein